MTDTAPAKHALTMKINTTPAPANPITEPASHPCPSSPQDHVILLHGLGRTRRAMLGLKWRLERAGYEVTNLAYPSRSKRLAEIVSEHVGPAIEKVRRDLEPGARVHFVTHSLGGIVFRAWAARRPEDFPLGNTVMLAAPNKGNEIVDHLAERWWFHGLLGPVVEELGTEPDSLANSLGPVPPATLVVMGNRPRIQLFAHLFGREREHDGVVSVERGHVEGEAGFHVMEADHTFIMWRKPVLDLVERHLRGDALRSKAARQEGQGVKEAKAGTVRSPLDLLDACLTS